MEVQEVPINEIKRGDRIDAIVSVPYPTKKDHDAIKKFPLKMKITSVGKLFMNAEWIGQKMKPKMLARCNVEIAGGKLDIHRIITAKKIVIGAPA